MASFIITQTHQQLRCSVEQGTIGPHHDPYSALTVSADTGTKSAEYYEDGLGTVRVKCFNIEGKVTVEYKGHSPLMRGQVDVAKFKARLFFRRWVGIDPIEIESEYNALPEDPMGSLARYV